MKAILLAGGKGTRLRPLTIHTPKPIVPIFDRPFLHYQLDLLKQVPEIDEVVLSLNYQPRRIEEIFGDGSDSGLAIKYVVEPAPLGTAGAVRYAGESLRESVAGFNGDSLTEINPRAIVGLHRERKAKATGGITEHSTAGRDRCSRTARAHGFRPRRASRTARRSRAHASSTPGRSLNPARASAPTASSAGSATSRNRRSSRTRSSGPTAASA